MNKLLGCFEIDTIFFPFYNDLIRKLLSTCVQNPADPMQA